MTSPERVPWMCKDEWEACRDHLFGSDISLKRRALEHLYIWKVRCINLPIAVECTLILLDAHLGGCDRNPNNEEMFTNTMSYESWYSVAIMRFLNLITDSNVGGKASSSMNQLAKLYEIPEWIVDIRHAVAHGPLLPSLSSLKEAVEKCLQWLYESYWSENMYEDYVPNPNESSLSSTFMCFEVCLLLKKYLSSGLETMSDLPVSERENISRVLSKNSETPNDSVCEWSLTRIYENMLKKFGRHLKRSTEYGEKLVQSILESDQYLLSPVGLEDDRLSEANLSLWSDVLFIICESSLCFHFLKELIKVVNSPMESSLRQYCGALYLDMILENIETSKKINSEDMNYENGCSKRKKVKKSNVTVVSDQVVRLNYVKLTDEEVASLIHIALNKPDRKVKIFLRRLLSLFDAPRKYDELITLTDIYLGCQLSTSYQAAEDGIRTVEELPRSPTTELILREVKEEFNANEISRDAEMVDSQWKNTPLGLLPWQSSSQPWLYNYDSDF